MLDSVSPDAPIEIDYDITSEDVLALHRLVEDSPAAIGAGRRQAFFAVLCAFAGIGFAVLSKEEMGILGALLVCLLLAPYQLTKRRHQRRWYRSKHYRRIKEVYEKSGGLFEGKPARFLLTAEGCSVTTPDGSQTLPWLAIRRVSVTARHVFLFTAPKAAMIVPRRAFVDSRTFEEFASLARGYQQAARSANG